MSDPTPVFQQGTTPPTPSGSATAGAPPQPGSVQPTMMPSSPVLTPPVLKPPVPPSHSMLGSEATVVPVPAPKPLAQTTSTAPVPQPIAPRPQFNTPTQSTMPMQSGMPTAPARVIPQAPIKPVAPPAPVAPAAAAVKPATPPPAGLRPSIQEKPGASMAHQNNNVTKSPFRFLPFILGALLLIGGIWFAFTKIFGIATLPSLTTQTPKTSDTTTTVPQKQTTITWWGLWETTPVLDEVLRAFESQNPGVKVAYVQESPKDYRERLQDALKKGEGPDVFRFHNSWVQMLRSQMSTLPATVMTQDQYGTTFYAVASKDLTTTEGIVGIPLMYDSIGLYYNKKIFETAGQTPPKTWNDVDTLASSLTVKETNGKIQRAGIALGTTSNVDHWPEILTLLLLQNGADPSNLTTPLATQAFKYYTDFNKVKHVWDDTLPASTYAFATEKTAMMLAPSWRAFEVKAINPALDFGIAQVPQLPGTDITVASYWAEGVSKTSKQQEMSWKLLKYLSTPEVLQKLYASAAQKTPRLFGEIYPRPEMASAVSSDPYVGAFVSDAPKAVSWHMNARTFDNGINDKIIKYVGDAINAINTSAGAMADALSTADQGVKQVLQQYGVPVTQSAAPTGAGTSTGIAKP